MEIEKIKKQLLEDKEFMEKIFEYGRKRENEEFRKAIKSKTSSVAGTTNDDEIKN